MSFFFVFLQKISREKNTMEANFLNYDNILDQQDIENLFADQVDDNSTQ